VKDQLKSQMLQALKATGLKDDEVAAVAAVDRPYVIFDYCEGITREFSMPGRDGPPRWEAFWASYEGLDRPSAQDLRAFLTGFGAPLEPWREALLQDLEHFEKTGDHRRRQTWERRREWCVWTDGGGWPEGEAPPTEKRTK